MSEENQENTQSESVSEARKYAGKFDTIEQLEEGYKNSAKVYQENETLKKQLEGVSKAPDDYAQPEGIELAESDLNEIKNLAKNAGLSQSHFEKLASQWASKTQSKKQAFEQSIKDIGDETLNVLKDYVSKNYPEKVADTVLSKLITDKDARESALSHRSQMLNSSAPGLSKVNMSLSYNVTHDDVLKARQAYEGQKSNIKLRDRYIALTAEYAKQKEGA